MKKILLYILTISMLLTSSVFTNVATALVRTTTTNKALEDAKYTAISTEAQFRAMANGGKYYLANDIALEQGFYRFPNNITLNGNGHAILPPSNTNESNPLLPENYYSNPETGVKGVRLLKTCNGPTSTKPSQSSDVNHNTYETICFFAFGTGGSQTVVFENLSFGTSTRPFCMRDDAINNDYSGMALFPTSEKVSKLTCTNVDFHVRLDKPAGSGNMAGFMSVAYYQTTMTNCNMDAVILGENISNQAGCFFAQTQNSTEAKLTMTGCTVLAGSLLKKKAQTGGLVGQVSGNATFTDCVNYCDLVQTGGQHAGGIAANLFESGRSIKFTRCINYGTIQGRQSTGGICGSIIGDGNWKSSTNKVTATFEFCINSGKVRPSPYTETTTTTKDAEGKEQTETVRTYYGEAIGGILGSYHNYTTISMDNCINVGIICGPEKETSNAGCHYESAGHLIGDVAKMHVNGTDSYDTLCNSTFTTTGTGDDAVTTRTCTCLKTTNGKKDTSPYTFADSNWTWHYAYYADPVKITNCYAYGEFLFPTHGRRMNEATGTDSANTFYDNRQSYRHSGFVGVAVRIDSASGNNHQVDRQHEPIWYETFNGESKLLSDFRTYTENGVEKTAKIRTAAGVKNLNDWLVARKTELLNAGNTHAAENFTFRYMVDYAGLSSGMNQSGNNADGSPGKDVVSTTPYVVSTPKIAAMLSSSQHDNVRIVAMLNSWEYTKVGFNYSFYVYDEQWTEEIRTKPVEQWDEESRFGSVDYWTTAIYDNVGELRTADELGGQFLYEMTILNMPKDKIVRLNIVPKAFAMNYYLSTGSGESNNRHEIIGRRYNLYFYNGEMVRCEISNP